MAEAFQMAVLKKLPILYVVQDNGWDISANEKETRAQNAAEYAKGFNGLEAISIDGTNFEESYTTVKNAIETIREERRPMLIHAKVPLLNHHTSGVRMEFYRDDLEEARTRDPFPKMKKYLAENGFSEDELEAIEALARVKVKEDYAEAEKAEDPSPKDLFTHDFACSAKQSPRTPTLQIGQISVSNDPLSCFAQTFTWKGNDARKNFLLHSGQLTLLPVRI